MWLVGGREGRRDYAVSVYYVRGPLDKDGPCGCECEYECECVCMCNLVANEASSRLDDA